MSHVVESIRYDWILRWTTRFARMQYILFDNKYQTIHQPVTPFTFTLLMRVTAELIYTHIDDLIWSFVKEK